ncbi:hypothetical protein LXL04_029807 [Taraxacum kok-saghyz]
MKIKQNFTSVVHPQSNGLVEVTNRTIVKGIKRRLTQAGGSWADELQNVLWSYRTTIHTSTQETPFSLVYGMEAVIPIELTMLTERTSSMNELKEGENVKSIQTHLDLLDEKRANALIRQEAYKCMTERFYNKRVQGRACKVGEMVLRKTEASGQESGGKLGPNWEGP